MGRKGSNILRSVTHKNEWQAAEDVLTIKKICLTGHILIFFPICRSGTTPSVTHTDVTSPVHALSCATISPVSHSAPSPVLFSHCQNSDKISVITLHPCNAQTTVLCPFYHAELTCRHSVTLGHVILKYVISEN